MCTTRVQWVAHTARVSGSRGLRTGGMRASGSASGSASASGSGLGSGPPGWRAAAGFDGAALARTCFVPGEGPEVMVVRGEGEGGGDARLAGLAFAAKDAFDVAGRVTGFGSPAWAATHAAPAAAHAAAVARLVGAGATLRGKTVMDELAFSLTGANPHFGTPANPWGGEGGGAPPPPGRRRRRLRLPGGSSAGSAAAVALGACDFALGTDTAGSVRLPASWCGVYGFRPTHGAVSLAGAQPLAPSLDAAGWFARDPEVLARVGDVLLPPPLPAGDPPPPPLARAIVAADALAALDDAADARALGRALEGGGLRGAAFASTSRAEVGVVPGAAEGGLAAWVPVFVGTQLAEVWAAHGAWVEEASARLPEGQPLFGDPGVRARMEAARDAAARETPEEAEARAATRRALAAHLDAMLGQDGVILLPTTPCRAPAAAEVEGGGSGSGSAGDSGDGFDQDLRTRSLQCLAPASLAGLPQVSIPLLPPDEELRRDPMARPLALSLLGPRHSDRRLLRLAVDLARTLPVDTRRL